MAQTALGAREVIQAWGKILTGYRPNLSIEITKECPLRCPGCYAYGDEHLGGGVTLRGLADYKGDELVTAFHGADRSPQAAARLDRRRRTAGALSRAWTDSSATRCQRGIHAQVVTSAVRQIPAEWAALPRLQIVVSIDGLPAEHDVRRTPATYERILKHIAGHQITVHCTVTRQQVRRDGYLEEFLAYWQQNPNTRLIWMSLYTPQIGELSMERLSQADRERVVADLRRLRQKFSKLQLPEGAAQRVREAARFARSTASSRRRPSASRRTWSATSHRVSSGGTPTATTAAAWRRRDSKRSGATASRAEFRSARSSTRH